MYSIPQAIAQAEIDDDAEQGARLADELDDKWFREGIELFESDADMTECWNAMQRTGWRFAEALNVV